MIPQHQPNPTSTNPPSEFTDQLSVVLSASRRRHILTALAASSGEIHIEDLASAVSAYEQLEATEPDPHVSDSRIAISLYHCHLPKLARAGLVTNEYTTGPIELTIRGKECATALGLQPPNRPE